MLDLSAGISKNASLAQLPEATLWALFQRQAALSWQLFESRSLHANLLILRPNTRRFKACHAKRLFKLMQLQAQRLLTLPVCAASCLRGYHSTRRAKVMTAFVTPTSEAVERSSSPVSTSDTSQPTSQTSSAVSAQLLSVAPM